MFRLILGGCDSWYASAELAGKSTGELEEIWQRQMASVRSAVLSSHSSSGGQPCPSRQHPAVQGELATTLGALTIESTPASTLPSPSASAGASGASGSGLSTAIKEAQELKVWGNADYRAGRYGPAAKLYTRAVDALEGEPRTSPEHVPLLASLLSNRGQCQVELGDRAQDR